MDIQLDQPETLEGQLYGRNFKGVDQEKRFAGRIAIGESTDNPSINVRLHVKTVASCYITVHEYSPVHVTHVSDAIESVAKDGVATNIIKTVIQKGAED